MSVAARWTLQDAQELAVRIREPSVARRFQQALAHGGRWWPRHPLRHAQPMPWKGADVRHQFRGTRVAGRGSCEHPCAPDQLVPLAELRAGAHFPFHCRDDLHQQLTGRRYVCSYARAQTRQQRCRVRDAAGVSAARHQGCPRPG